VGQPARGRCPEREQARWPTGNPRKPDRGRDNYRTNPKNSVPSPRTHGCVELVPTEPKEFSREIENLVAEFRALPTDNSRSRRRPTRDLGGLVDELLVKYRISHDSLEHSIREKWPELVGIANATYSHPVVVERNQLLVLVSHSVVRQELFHHRLSILEKLKQLPGCADIKGLTLRAG
jgi:hypothetical protein